MTHSSCSLVTLLSSLFLASPSDQPDPSTLQNIRKIYLNNNRIQTLWREVFSSGAVVVDLSNNEIEADYPLNSVPGRNFEYLNLQGNSKLSYDTLPLWADPMTTRIQLANQSYACQSLSVNTAVAMTFLVDPTFFKYKYCECQAGTFGKAPLCNVVPNNADLNPFTVISSKEIGDAFPTLIQSAGGIGSNLTETSAQNVTTYVQAFSDSMYGQNRLVQGLMTSWSIDLTNLYSDDVDPLIAQDITPPSTPAVYHPTAPSDIHPDWTPVRSITVRLHISGTTFTQFDDVITVWSSGADLKGDRIMTIRGTDEKPKESSSDYTTTQVYQQKYHQSIAAISDPRLIEVQVFSSIATVQFTSRQTSGQYFYATYSYDFVCPPGFFYDRITNPKVPKCRENYEIHSVSSNLRAAVFGVSAVAMFLAGVCIVSIGVYWNHGVFRAASRSFMLLILVMIEAMSLGAMLYAAVPDVHSTSSGNAVCIGRAWLTCLPLAAILAIMLAKNRRMWAIFGATKLQVKTHSDLDLLITVLLISALQCVLLAVFSGLPLSKPVLELGHGSLSATLVKSCSQESGFMSWIGAEIAFVCALMLPTAYLGFKTRNLPSQYNESGHLQNALILLMFFMVIIVPLDIFVQDDPSSAVLLQGLSQAFLTILLTLIIFGPKLYFISQTNDHRGGLANATKAPNSNVGMKHSSTPITPGDNTNPPPTAITTGQGRNRQGSLEVQQGLNSKRGSISGQLNMSPMAGDSKKTLGVERRSFPATATRISRQPSVSTSADSSPPQMHLTIAAATSVAPVLQGGTETPEAEVELAEIQPAVQ